MAEPGTALTPRRREQLRVVLLGLGLWAVVGGAAACGPLLDEGVAGQTDYVQYAAAARLLADGKNPYDAEQLLALQRSAGWTGEYAQMMWNPPWSLPLVLPLELFSWPAGYLGWSALQFVAVAAGAVAVWRVYAGPRHWWVAVAVAALFPPVVFLVKVGQIAGFVFLGLAVFVQATRAGSPGVAGLAAALTAIKPHLLLPFAVLLACDAVVRGTTRRAVLAGAGCLALAAAAPLAFNRDVWRQYLDAVNAPTDRFHLAPSDWDPPSPASLFEDAVGGGLPVQFAPSVVATAVLVGYWSVRRRDWDWGRELPRVVLLSVLTSGYGAWGFDLVVLLLPIVQAAAWLANHPNPRLVISSPAGYLVFCAAVLTNLLPIPWWAPVIAAGYLAVAWVTRPSASTDPVPVSPPPPTVPV